MPVFGDPADPGLLFTERRMDLRRHAGEISFPGGRRDGPGEELMETALREAEEEIGIDPASVRMLGALPPIGTFVTNYKVHPFVGRIPDDVRRCGRTRTRSPTILAFELEAASRRVRDAAPGAARRYRSARRPTTSAST